MTAYEVRFCVTGYIGYYIKDATDEADAIQQARNRFAKDENPEVEALEEWKDAHMVNKDG